MKRHFYATIPIVLFVAAGSLLGQQSSQQWPPQAGAGAPAPVAQSQQTPAQNDIAELSSLLRDAKNLSLERRVRDQADQVVLVVPAPGLPADGLVAITEDMTVMCRILDKLMMQVAITPGTAYLFDPFTGQGAESHSPTQGLYLDGCGAMFFLEVGFPLVAPAQDQERPKTDPSTDSLWSRTVDELQGIPPKRPYAAGQEYDGQKVEALKTTLTKSLRHAANMRVRGLQDSITVVVTTRTRSESGLDFVYGTTQPGATTWAAPATGSSDVLVLRTTKGDVDAFAKGDLTAEQFASKVQTVRSWTSSGREAGSQTGLALPSSGHSGPYGR